MLRLAAIFLFCAFISACSSVETRQRANGSFDYLQEQKQKALLIPANVDSPVLVNEFAIPQKKDSYASDATGEALVISSPSLVLPLVSGSYIEEGYRGAKVFFDQVDEKQSLDTTIWNALLSFLEEQSIGVDYFDKEEQKLITDWIVTEYEIDSSWYSWSNTIQTVSQRFEMTLNLKPHGRSAALEVKLLEYKEIVESTESSNVSDIVKRTNEVDILNQVIGHYDQQLRVAQAKQIQKIRTGISTEMGFNADGQPAYLLAADFDIAWPRLLLVLRKMGFNVTDLDKSNGLLFVDYTGGETSWWGNLWGQEKAVLEEDEYRMQVDAIGKKVAVSISDKDNQPFTAKQVSALYDSFSSYMQSDDLDI